MDFSHKSLLPGNHLKTFFKRNLTDEEIEFIKCSKEGLTFRLSKELGLDEETHFRIFYHNLEAVRAVVPYIFAILPDEPSNAQFKRIADIAKVIIIAGANREIASAYLQDYPFLRKRSLTWLVKGYPDKRKYRDAYEAVQKSYSRCREIRRVDWIKQPERFAKALTFLFKAEILKKNPLDGFLRIFRNFFLLFVLAVVAIPFLIPSSVDVGISNVRERNSERDRLSLAPYFEYTFDGKESMQRLSRYAIGRFMSVITDEKMDTTKISDWSTTEMFLQKEQLSSSPNRNLSKVRHRTPSATPGDTGHLSCLILSPILRNSITKNRPRNTGNTTE